MRSPRALIVGLSFVGMLVIQLGWLLTIPPFHGIDEIDHAYRASMVGQGQWRVHSTPLEGHVGRGDVVRVRADIVAAAHAPCMEFEYYGPANCSPYVSSSDPGDVLVASSAARYNPAYYAVVQAVAGHFRGYQSLYALRGMSALLCAGMFAAGLWALLTFCRSRWLPAMFFLAATPVMLYSTTLAAPNGLEMVSGLTLWAALLGLFVAPPPGRSVRAGLLTVTGVSASTLVTVHTLGPMWLGTIALVVLVLAGPGDVWRRVRAHPLGHVVTFAVVVVASLASAAWVVLSGANNPALEPTLTDKSPFPDVLLALPLWPLQAIATYPSRDDPAPLAVYAMALIVMTLAILLAAGRLGRRRTVALLLVVGLSYAIPLVLTVASFSKVGLAWQGRYGLPLAVGFFLILGLALDSDAKGPRLGRVALGLTGLLLALELAISQRHVVQREMTLLVWQNSPHWAPPSTVVLTALAFVGSALWLIAMGRVREDRR